MYEVWLLYLRYQAYILGSMGIILFFVLWQIISDFEIIEPFFISSPTKIFNAFKKSLNSGQWFQDVAISSSEFMVAYGLGVVVGIPLGFICGWYRYAEYFIDPLIWMKYSTPMIALYPIFIAIFGLGSIVVIILSFLICFTPIYTNTFTGVKTVNPLLIQCAKSFGAGDKDIFLKIAIPASIPLIIAGLRIAIGRALLGVVIGELFGADAGVGFRLGYSAGRMEIADYFVAVLTIVFVGVLLSQALLLIERRFAIYQT